MTCNIWENAAQLNGDDDITFDNNVMMINAKQNKDDGYTRTVKVRCSTDGFLTHTDSEEIEVKQFSRCVGKDALTKDNADSVIVSVTEGWAASNTGVLIDYGIKSTYNWCQMTCEWRRADDAGAYVQPTGKFAI